MSREIAEDPGSETTVGLLSVPIAGFAPDREHLMLTAHPRNTALIWVRKAATGAVAGQGFYLGPGDTYVDDRERIYYGPYCAVAEAEGQKIAKVEE